MSDVDDFLAEIHPRLVAELQALHNGDPQPRLAMWSTKDPVTLFGAGMSGRGWDKVSGIFRLIASRWSDCTDQRVEMLAAGVSGDLAYTVELEHTSVSLDGVPVEPYTLGSPRSTATRMASGRSSTATATRSRSTSARAFPAKHPDDQRKRRSPSASPSLAGRPAGSSAAGLGRWRAGWR